MTEITEINALDTWSTESCPFTIEYSRRVLDDIRLAVVDAFFSLPRGGAEIGGVLLGKFADGRLTILESAPLECEHIFGPSFTLSPGDQARLADLLAGLRLHISDLQPVGWYHSHTRTDIFLSESDLDIHNRYFPDPWQVALVLRPSTFQPVQAGFFFREADGSIRTKNSYQEFALDPLPVGQVPKGLPPAPPAPSWRQPEAEGPVITLLPDPTPAPRSTLSLENVVAPVGASEPPASMRSVLLPPALPPLPDLSPGPQLLNSRNDELPPTPVEEAGEERPELVEESDLQMWDEPQVATEPVVWDEPQVVTEPPVVTEPQLASEALESVEASPAYTEPEAMIAEPLTASEPAAEMPQAAEATPEPPAPRLAAEVPSFLQVEPARPRRWGWIAAAAVIAVVGVVVYQQRDSWLSPLTEGMSGQTAQHPTQSSAALPAPVPSVTLAATDNQGQLQIRWDSHSPAITQARDAVLQITDNGVTTDLPLDPAHLQAGEFTYLRRGEHIDARLTIQELDGSQARGLTTFFGPSPQPLAPPSRELASRKEFADLVKKNADLTTENADLRQQRDELANQAAQLKSAAGARAESGKQSAALAKENADLRQQRDDLTRQNAQLKSTLTARADSGKQSAAMGKENNDLRQQRDELTRQNAQLKSDLAARAESGKQSGAVAKENADLRQQRDELNKQIAKLRTDLAARTESGNQKADLAKENALLRQQKDDLIKQAAKLRSDLAARAGSTPPNGELAKENAELRQERNSLLTRANQLKAELAARGVSGSAPSDDLSKQRFDLTNQVTRLKSDVAIANARADRLAQQLEELRKQQQKKRLQNQTGESTQ